MGEVNARARFNNEVRYRPGDSDRHRYLTPGYVLDLVRADLGGHIGLDPCTEPDNPTLAQSFYTVTDDGLAQPWRSDGWTPSVFVNPPYGKAREPWMTRCAEAGAAGQAVVLLVPAATDTRAFQTAARAAGEFVLIRSRLKFGVLRKNRRQEAASHPSAIFAWNVELTRTGVLGVRVVAK